MFDFFKKRLQGNQGSMDKILVTLLLVVVGVGGVIGLSAWLSGQSTEIRADVQTSVDAAKRN